jgi:hypothetical protein
MFFTGVKTGSGRLGITVKTGEYRPDYGTVAKTRARDGPGRRKKLGKRAEKLESGPGSGRLGVILPAELINSF